MMRPVTAFIFIVLPLLAFAQRSLLEQKVTLKAGQYSGEELLKALLDQGITVNYSSGTVRQILLKHSGEDLSVRDILKQAFDEEKYTFIQRNEKILVIPLSRKKGYTFSGYVEEQESRERLIGVNIFLPEYKMGTTSNEFGFFSMVIPENGETTALFSYIGYEKKVLPISSQDSTVSEILLAPESEQLKEVTVEGHKLSAEVAQMSHLKLSPQLLRETPAMFGEADILKSIQMLPGIQRGSEGNINFFVRGGGPDQNLLLLDGVPVYNASHLFGFFSIFNVDAVKSVELTKGGFPARFGGRLSSVLEVNMKEGNMQEFHGSGSVGLIASKLTLEGPIVTDRTSFMISGRRTYFDLLARPFLKNSTNLGYFFGDLNVKLNHKFSEKDRLYLSFYHGGDRLFYDAPENSIDFKWGNYTGILRWNHLYSNKLFGNLSVVYSQYQLALDLQYEGLLTNNDNYRAGYTSLIRDYGFRYDFDYTYDSRHYIKSGVSYTYHIFRPGRFQQNEIGSLNLDSVIDFTPQVFSNDMFIYAEDNWQINTRWQVNSGLHLSLYNTGSKSYTSLQPRVCARYLIDKSWSLKASYAYMKQFIHLLANTGTSLPTDLWVSSSERVPPQNSHQWALGTSKNLNGRTWELSSEVYYKYFTGLIAYKQAASSAFAVDWEDQVVTGGTGEAYGWETMLQKNTGKTTGWIAYTLSWSDRRFDELNGGETFPFKYDRRHDFKILLNQRFSEKFNVGLTWQFNTGQRATIPLSTYNTADGQVVTRYSKRNEFIYPSYHRLDLSFNFNKETKWGERTWAVGLYNVYSRQNPYYIFFETTESRRVARQISIFPFIPSVSYNFSF